MAQIYVILDPGTGAGFCPGDHIDAFVHNLPPLVERNFDIVGRNDVSITIVTARKTTGEANIQVEIRYTVGTDEYGTGEIFDPPPEVQEKLCDDIHKRFVIFPGLQFRAPTLTLSVWCQPHRGGTFKLYV